MDGEVKYSIQPSAIHGVGVVATVPIAANENIGVAVTMDAYSVGITDDLGRYINHSYKPNGRLLMSGGNLNLVTTQPIAANEEVTVDYNYLPWFLERAKAGYV